MKLNLEEMSDKIFEKLITQRGGKKTKRRKKRRKKKSKTYRKKKRKTRRNKRRRLRKKTKRRRRRRQRGGKVDLSFKQPNLTFQDSQAATKGAIYKNEQNDVALSKLQKGGRQKGGRQVEVKQMHSAGDTANANLNRTVQALLNARIDAKGDSLAGTAKTL